VNSVDNMNLIQIAEPEARRERADHQHLVLGFVAKMCWESVAVKHAPPDDEFCRPA